MFLIKKSKMCNSYAIVTVICKLLKMSLFILAFGVPSIAHYIALHGMDFAVKLSSGGVDDAGDSRIHRVLTVL